MQIFINVCAFGVVSSVLVVEDFLCNSINVTASFGLTFNSDLHSYSCRLGYLLFILYLKYNSSEFIHVLVEEI